MNQEKKLSPAIAALIVIVLVGIVASVVIVVNNKGGMAAIGNKLTSVNDRIHGTSDPVVAPQSTDTSTYKDGTYTATGSYISPGGVESLDLTVTIKDGVITDTSLINHPTEQEAAQHQQLFADHYKALIVGKKINDVASLSRVAGSSLTSNGFNDALDSIKNDARA